MNTESTNTTVVKGQESWTVETPAVKAAVSVAGAMMAPVDFVLAPEKTGGRDRTAAPYYVSPWHDEDLSRVEPGVLKPLRGDFFCCPFGAANAVDDEDHSPHGEAAYRDWTFDSMQEGTDCTTLTVSMDYSACPGRITRELLFGRHAPYVLSRSTLAGFSGRYPVGYHATLGCGGGEGTWKLYTDTFDLGMTCPDFTVPMADNEYYALEAGAPFDSLEEVPTRWKNPASTDCTQFPGRPGFVDVLAVYRRRGPDLPLESRLSWTIAVNRRDGYFWYSIKDASRLPATVFWWENGGRHGAPWSGRNCCLGIEETCTFFASGRTESIADNIVSRQGIPTAAALTRDTPSQFWTLQGVLPMDNPERAVTGLTLRDGYPCFTDDSGATHPIAVKLAEVIGESRGD